MTGIAYLERNQPPIIQSSALRCGCCRSSSFPFPSRLRPNRIPKWSKSGVQICRSWVRGHDPRPNNFSDLEKVIMRMRESLRDSHSNPLHPHTDSRSRLSR